MAATIRPATPDDAPAIARVHVASWRTTYAGLMPAEALAALSVERRERNWRAILGGGSDIFVHVAEDGAAGVAGFASGSPTSSEIPAYPGELQAIYLLADEQRRGLGRLLVAATARHMAALGVPAMLLWVLEENTPARRFYESLGGVLVGRQPYEIGGVTLMEVAYGWRDLPALTARAASERSLE